jgi:hypothetical protein
MIDDQHRIGEILNGFDLRRDLVAVHPRLRDIDDRGRCGQFPRSRGSVPAAAGSKASGQQRGQEISRVRGHHSVPQ